MSVLDHFRINNMHILCGGGTWWLPQNTNLPHIKHIDYKFYKNISVCWKM